MLLQVSSKRLHFLPHRSSRR